MPSTAPSRWACACSQRTLSPDLSLAQARKPHGALAKTGSDAHAMAKSPFVARRPGSKGRSYFPAEERTTSLLQADPSEQPHKTGIETEWISYGIDAEIDKAVVVFFVGSFKPIDSCAVFTEAGVNGREVE